MAKDKDPETESPTSMTTINTPVAALEVPLESNISQNILNDDDNNNVSNAINETFCEEIINNSSLFYQSTNHSSYFNYSSHPCADFFDALQNATIGVSSAPSIAPTFPPTVAPTWPPPPTRPPSNTTKPEREGMIQNTDTMVLVGTIQVYGTVYLLLMVLFCLLRKKYNKLYNVRSWAEGIQCQLAKNAESYGLISWMWEVFHVDEDDILNQCGLDALCFIRVLRMGRKLAIMGCFHACWLIPVYYTAEDSIDTYYLVDRLVIISTSNLPESSNRFLATVICAYCIFIYCMYLMKGELKWYTEQRHKFLRQRRARNYAVYVSGIPENLRSSTKLADFFRQSGASTSVLEAQIVLACPELESLVAQRKSIKERLVHAKAYEEIKGARQSIYQFNLMGMNGSMHHGISRSMQNNEDNGLVATVDSIEVLEMKLRQLTKDIAIAYQNIERYNDPYTLEEHRNMVMEEIEETRRAERAQNIAKRERVNSDHDMDNVEEICHFEVDISPEKKLPVNEQFSKIAEAFFFGNLSPEQRQQQQKLIQKETKQNDDYRVTIHSEHNKVHYMSWHSDDDDDDDDDGFGRLGHQKDDSEEKKRGDSRSIRTRLLHSKFPSKSTISTDPGTFEHHSPTRWNDANSLPSNGFHSPGDTTPQMDDGELSTQSGDNDQKGYHQVLREVHRMQSHKENSHSSEADEMKESSRSWRSDPGHVIKSVGEEVGKTVKHVGSSVGKVTKHVGILGVKNVKENVNNLGFNLVEISAGNIKTIRDSAAAIAPVVMVLEEGKALSGGFVVFKDLYSTQAALQMLHHKDAGVMKVEEAPGPDEIFWRNVGLPGKAQQTGRLLSLAATATLCLFWTFPVSLISSMTEVNSLKQKSELLSSWIERFPNMEHILALLAPLLLLILQDVVLPEFLEWFAAWEGHISSSALEAAVFVKYAAFVLIQTFFISAISGSIAAELANMLNKPDRAIQQMAIALPAQSNYFLQILIVAMAVNLSMELLRVAPLGLAFARRFVGPNLTKEERNKKWKFLNPLSEPYEFEHANISGSIVLYFMVFFVYCCLAPVVSFFLLVMFVCLESGYRYNFYCNYPPFPDSGGKLWKGFFYILLSCIIFAQLTLVGFLVLKRSLFAIPLMVPLLVISILFVIYLNRYKIHAADHLPTSDCVRVDQKSRLRDFNFVKGQYVQPAIREAQSDEIFEII